MAAYPYTVQTLEPQGVYNVPSGSIVCSEFVMTPNSRLTITMIKPALTQDFSVRCWISRFPAGTSIETIKPEIAFWNPDRIVVNAVCLHTGPLGSQDSDILTYNLPTVPGIHYLNVLNLINMPNTYAGTFTFEEIFNQS